MLTLVKPSATTSCGRRAVGEVKIKQEDREAAAEFKCAMAFGRPKATELHSILRREMEGDIDMLTYCFARHRQAAEKAQQERDAGIADAHRKARLEAAKNAHSRKAKAEARDHESMSIEALHIATAIRSQGHE